MEDDEEGLEFSSSLAGGALRLSQQERYAGKIIETFKGESECLHLR